MERLRFVSPHDSNTIRRSGQGVRLSVGGGGEGGVEAGEPAEAREHTAEQTDVTRGYGQGNTGVGTHTHTLILFQYTPQHTMLRPLIHQQIPKYYPTKL